MMELPVDQSPMFDNSLLVELDTQDEKQSIGAKLAREAQLLVAGAAGFGKAAQDSVSAENLGETAAKVVTGVCIGAGIAGLSLGRSLARLGAQAIGATGTVAFAGSALRHGELAAEAMKDSWNADTNAQWNRNVCMMEAAVGRFAFDTALMAASGVAGVTLQPKFSFGFSRKTPLESSPVEGIAVLDPRYALGFKPESNAVSNLLTFRPFQLGRTEIMTAESSMAQIAQRYQDSIVRIRASVPDQTVPTKGTGFLIGKDGTVATCHHVVENSNGITIEMKGKTYVARIKSVDAFNDLALLRAEHLPPEKIQPLPVAESTRNVKPDSETVCLSYGGATSLVRSPGVVDGVSVQLPEGSPSMLAGDALAVFISQRARTFGGASGAPVFSTLTGEVIGVHSIGNRTDACYARPAEALRSLMGRSAES